MKLNFYKTELRHIYLRETVFIVHVYAYQTKLFQPEIVANAGERKDAYLLLEARQTRRVVLLSPRSALRRS